MSFCQDVYRCIFVSARIFPVERTQLNLRISDDLAKLIDGRRIDLSKEMGGIPSRSDILRFALEQYLGVDLSHLEVDRRKKVARTPE